MRNAICKYLPVLALSVLLTGTTLSAQDANHPLASTFRDWQMLIRGEVGFVVTESKQNIKLIKSVDDWEQFLEQMQSDSYHPLTGIDKGVLRKFAQNLQFDNYGITGAYVGGIEREISHYNYVRLWEHFGMTEMLVSRLRGYKCDSAGSVHAISTYICMRLSMHPHVR